MHIRKLTDLLGMLGLFLFAALIGCERTSDQSGSKVEGSANAEAGVRLSQQAQAAIGLKTEQADERSVQTTLPAAGWLMPEPGRESVVKAPVSGFYMPVSENSHVQVGAMISRDESLGSLHVLISPQEEAQLVAAKEDTDILMNQALVSLRLAEEQLNRLKEGGEKVVPGTRLLDLQEIVERNKVAYREARERLPYLPEEPYAEKLSLKPVGVDSPIGGRITHMHVAPRQFVVQGDPLWTVADWSKLWVRVPVFIGDLPEVLKDEHARVSGPGPASVVEALPVRAAQPVQPGRRTVDLYYRLDNSDGVFRSGEPVSVQLPAGRTEMQVVIPRTAVVWDGFGNAWVYVRTGPESFRRQRVELGSGDAETVSVLRGMTKGRQVVTVGAEALYGEEFKGQIQVEDDD